MTHTSSNQGGNSLLELAAKVEVATGPDAQADYFIHALVMGWRVPDDCHCFSWYVGEKYQFGHPDDERRAIYISESELPNYTASLDAAMTLVPDDENHFPTVSKYFNGKWSARCYEQFSGKNNSAVAATPALALTAAALKARAPLTPQEPK